MLDLEYVSLNVPRVLALLNKYVRSPALETALVADSELSFAGRSNVGNERKRKRPVDSHGWAGHPPPFSSLSFFSPLSFLLRLFFFFFRSSSMIPLLQYPLIFYSTVLTTRPPLTKSTPLLHDPPPPPPFPQRFTVELDFAFYALPISPGFCELQCEPRRGR